MMLPVAAELSETKALRFVIDVAISQPLAGPAFDRRFAKSKRYMLEIKC